MSMINSARFNIQTFGSTLLPMEWSKNIIQLKAGDSQRNIRNALQARTANMTMR